MKSFALLLLLGLTARYAAPGAIRTQALNSQIRKTDLAGCRMGGAGTWATAMRHA